MAVYRSVQISFWTDAKVVDDFTPEDKFFYLYLFTNPHTNLCGCYEISKRQISIETGYSIESIEKLLYRFETFHNVIKYNHTSKEILLLNWYKYNWTTSDKFRKPLLKEIKAIKEQSFKEYLLRAYSGDDTVSTDERYGIDTVSSEKEYGIDTTVTATATVSNTENEDVIALKEKKNINTTKSDNISRSKSESQPAFILPCRNGKEYIVTQAEYKEMVNNYPHIDVMDELRRMEIWITDNRNNAKTISEAPKFIRGWLNDEDRKAAQRKVSADRNRLGTFGAYKQSSSDEEWEELTAMSVKDVNRRQTG